MTITKLIFRSLTFYWRTHLGVVIGVAIGSAVLIGALTVGDSVRYSLKRIALSRLGQVHFAMSSGERLCTEALAERIGLAIGSEAAPVFRLQGSTSVQGSGQTATVTLLGVDARFWELAPSSTQSPPLADGTAVINHWLADKLQIEPGTRLVLHAEKPSHLPREARIGAQVDHTIRFTVTVQAVVDDAGFGRFSLEPTQIPPLNVFVSLDSLQRELEADDRVNLILAGARHDGTASVDQLNSALQSHWQLDDVGVELRELEQLGALELRSPRVLIEPPVADAVRQAADNPQEIFSYFVNGLRAANGSATPYSMVAGLQVPSSGDQSCASPIPADMRDSQIVISQWLADDLGTGVGEDVTLDYYVIDVGGNLLEQSHTFQVCRVVATGSTGADRELMPDFPGLSDVESSRDWDPPVPIDLERIRDKDEQYWEEHRGMPKAFVTLAWAQRAWGNRFGKLTAMRWSLKHSSASGLSAALRQTLRATSVGLQFQPARDQALAASEQGFDFSSLFLGFSFFLIAAALVLTAMLFSFGVEQRIQQCGTMLAMGIERSRVRRVFLIEGGLLAIAGTTLGMVLAIAYTRRILWALTTLWHSAVGVDELHLHVEPASLLIGAVLSVIVSLTIIAWMLRRFARHPIHDLLSAEGKLQHPSSYRSQRRETWFVLLIYGVVAAAILIAALRPPSSAPTTFFFTGTLLLLANLWLCRLILKARANGAAVAHTSLAQLAARNASWRLRRSTAVVAMLACGCFLLIAVAANRQDPTADAEQRRSGTGGFALYAQTTFPIHEDLNQQRSQEKLALPESVMNGVSVVPIRVRDGDDASCLNLNRAQSPPLFGIAAEQLQSRDAFRFTKTLPHNGAEGWNLLTVSDPQGAVPAIADVNTAVWALGKKLGSTVDYLDQRGRAFQVRIVALISNSILQGGLLVDESMLRRHFPDISGYRAFLIDAPSDRLPQITAALDRSLESYGARTMVATERLAAFSAVQNTYLSIFGALGGLGLLLGTAGLGVVVLRSLLERRGELAAMRAIGFSMHQLKRLAIREHAMMLLMGVAAGVSAAVVAVIPSLRSTGAQVPYQLLGLTIIALLLSGMAWTVIAVSAALHGPILTALRDE